MYRGVQIYRGIQTPLVLKIPMPASNLGRHPYLKPKFLHLKSWKIIRKPPDSTQNEPTLDIPIGGSRQNIKK